MIRHTPGPWRFEKDEIVAADGTHIVCFGHDYDDYGAITARHSLIPPEPPYVQDNYKPYLEEVQANGRLIAAAPELLDAAERVFESEDDTTDCPADRTVVSKVAMKSLTTAIEKAKGTL